MYSTCVCWIALSCKHGSNKFINGLRINFAKVSVQISITAKLETLETWTRSYQQRIDWDFKRSPILNCKTIDEEHAPIPRCPSANGNFLGNLRKKTSHWAGSDASNLKSCSKSQSHIGCRNLWDIAFHTMQKACFHQNVKISEESECLLSR